MAPLTKRGAREGKWGKGVGVVGRSRVEENKMPKIVVIIDIL